MSDAPFRENAIRNIFRENRPGEVDPALTGVPPSRPAFVFGNGKSRSDSIFGHQYGGGDHLALLNGRAEVGACTGHSGSQYPVHIPLVVNSAD